MLARVLALTVLAASLLSACSSEEEAYCEAVEEHQAALSDIAASGEPAAVLGALDIYRDLRARAPSDLADEWAQVVGALEGLDEALDDAGVDPATWDPRESPKGLDEAERTRIEGAARHLGSDATRTAMAGIEQQALDVCKTPLSR